jgi:TonB-linked SusC/RagA family outer membrane protein
MGYSTNDNNRIQGLMSIKPIEGLEIYARYTHQKDNSEGFTPVNSYLSSNPGNGASNYYMNAINSVTRTSSQTGYDVIDLWANYKKSFGDHNITAMVGYNQEQSSYKKFSSKQEGLFSDELPSLNLGNGNKYVSDEMSEWSTRSAFYRLNYDYKGKYLFETVGRYDGSSRFSQNDRFVFVPSASLAWRISEESFMNWSRDVLDNLKLRASYGVQGNQSISNYAYLPSMGSTKANWIVGKEKPISITPAGIVSNSFTWESVKNTNFGLDVALFDNRFSATTEIYKRQTEGILMPSTELPALLGTSAPKTNAADLEVNGWELSVNWRDKIGEVSYRVGFNVYDSKTTIKNYANPASLYTKHYNGKLVGELWGYETDRLFTEDDFTLDASGKRVYKEGIANQNYIFGNRVPMPGDVKYKDLDGDGKIDAGKSTLDAPGDKKIIGNTSPRYQFGANIGLGYKGFDISMFFQGVGKRDLWIGNNQIFAYANAYESLFASAMDFWREDNKDAFYPRPIAGKSWNSQVQSQYLSNGAYLRMKNLTVGYTLPKTWINKLYLQDVRFYLSGENLFTVTGLPEGLDPELAGGYGHPFQKEYSFGVNVSF